MIHCTFFFIILCSAAVLTQTLEITNGPMNTTVCTGSIASMSCGFVNESVNFVPNWRIVRRSDNGSVISNMIVSSNDIVNNNIDGLEWVTDTTSGDDMSPNSRLLVGPVNETYNQSSYQCIFTVGGNTIESSVGTLTVTEIPAIDNLTAVDHCDFIEVNWSDIEGPCKNLSYNVTLQHSNHANSSTTNITTHIFNDTSKLRGNCSVRVFAFNENAMGKVDVEEADVRGVDLPTVTDVRNVSTICLSSFNISWDPPNSTTCGEVSYEVSISPPPIEGDAVVITFDSFLNITGLNNSLSDVTITVAAINRAGQGDGRMFPVQLPKSLDLPTVTNIRNVSTICVTYFDISWDAPSITCGDVYYEVSISQPPIEGDAVEVLNVTGLVDRFLHVTGLNNSLPDVTITVTAINREGRRNGMMYLVELPRSLLDTYYICRDSPQRCNITPSSFVTLDNVEGFDRLISWKRPIIDQCTTLPIISYVIRVDVTFMNGNSVTYTSKFIYDTQDDGMGMFSFYYSELFNDTLERNSTYMFIVYPINNIRNINVDGNVPAPSSPNDGCNDLCLILIIVGVCVIAVWIWCMSSLYCHEKIMEEGFSDKEDDRCGCVLILFTCGIAVLIRNYCSTSSNCRKIFFLISSFGLGYVVWIICRNCCLERTRASSVQQEMVMDEKSTDLYDSPGLKPKDTAAAAETQGLYSYARTGPINVIVPGSTNS